MHFYNVSIIDSFQCTMFESSNKKMVFVCCSSSDFISICICTVSNYLFFFSSSFLVKVRFVVIFCFFYYWLNVELEISQKFLLTIKLHRWQQHRMYKGSSGMGVASI